MTYLILLFALFIIGFVVGGGIAYAIVLRSRQG